MLVKLYNHSKIPSDVLRPLLERASRTLKCNGPVVVKTTRGGETVSSFARSCGWVARWHLANSSTRKDGAIREGRVTTTGGYVTIRPRIGKWHRSKDSFVRADDLFLTMLHEFAHIKDMQDGQYFGEYNRRHGNRPHEQRANEMAKQARLQKRTPGDQSRLLKQLNDLATVLETM